MRAIAVPFKLIILRSGDGHLFYIVDKQEKKHFVTDFIVDNA